MYRFEIVGNHCDTGDDPHSVDATDGIGTLASSVVVHEAPAGAPGPVPPGRALRI